MSNDNRHPAGTSLGGQWAPETSSEISIDDALDFDEEFAGVDFDAPESDGESLDGQPIVFAKAGQPVNDLQNGQLAVISDGDYYVLATSRGAVVAKHEDGIYSVSEYVRSEQTFPGAFADSSSEIAGLCREGSAVNRTWDSSVELANPRPDSGIAGADYRDIKTTMARSASGYLGAHASDQTEAEAFKASGFGPARLDNERDFDAAATYLADHPTTHPMPPKGQEGANRAVEGIKGVVKPSDIDRVFAYKSEGSHETYYGITDGSVWTRRTR